MTPYSQPKRCRDNHWLACNISRAKHQLLHTSPSCFYWFIWFSMLTWLDKTVMLIWACSHRNMILRKDNSKISCIPNVRLVKTTRNNWVIHWTWKTTKPKTIIFLERIKWRVKGKTNIVKQELWSLGVIIDWTYWSIRQETSGSKDKKIGI